MARTGTIALIIVMKNKNMIFVSPRKEGWAVKTVGTKRAAAIVDTKAEAFEIGRQIAKNNELELVVQNLDGKIGLRNSYGNDPTESKG